MFLKTPHSHFHSASTLKKWWVRHDQEQVLQMADKEFFFFKTSEQFFRLCASNKQRCCRIHIPFTWSLCADKACKSTVGPYTWLTRRKPLDLHHQPICNDYGVWLTHMWSFERSICCHTGVPTVFKCYVLQRSCKTTGTSLSWQLVLKLMCKMYLRC